MPFIPDPRDINGFVKAIEPFKFAGFAGINTLFIELCQHPRFKTLDFSAFKLTISSGAALTLAAVDIWQKTTGCSITEGYGLSETSPVLCLNTPLSEKIGTVGLPLVNTIIQIRDDQGNVLADGKEGEIVANGSQVMLEYLQQPEETIKVMTEDVFFKTGDIGIKLPNGCIKIVDPSFRTNLKLYNELILLI